MSKVKAERMRYVIRHHAGLYTSLRVEIEGQGEQEIENRYSLGVARQYCRDSCKEHGIDPVIEQPEWHVEVFPWV